jgi:hypothetical protein
MILQCNPEQQLTELKQEYNALAKTRMDMVMSNEPWTPQLLSDYASVRDQLWDKMNEINLLEQPLQEDIIKQLFNPYTF